MNIYPKETITTTRLACDNSEPAPSCPILNDHDKKVIQRTCDHFNLPVKFDLNADEAFICIHGYDFSIEREEWEEEITCVSLRGKRQETIQVSGWRVTKWMDGEDFPGERYGNVQALIAGLVCEAVFYRADCIDREEAQAEDYASERGVLPDPPEDNRSEGDRDGISWSPQHGFERT
jgi:hypothetical protein